MKRTAIWSPSFDGASGGIQALSEDVLWACRSAAASDTIELSRSGEPGLGDKVSFLARCGFSCLAARPGTVVAMHMAFLPAAAILKRLFGFRLAVWLHGIEAWGQPARLCSRCVLSVDLFLASSRVTHERSAQWRPEGIPCEVVHPTTDFAVFSPGPKNPALLARYGVAAGEDVILTVGRLAPGEAYKGQDAVIRALPALLSGRPMAKYLIVGSGRDRGRLENLAKETGVADRVIFAGHVPSAELPDHYRLAEVFAMPSAGEGFGISYLEALGCGCRVVAGAGDGASEALGGGALGTLVDPGNTGALVEALAEGLSRGRNDMLPDRVEELYGRDRFRRELLACLRSIQDPCVA